MGTTSGSTTASGVKTLWDWLVLLVIPLTLAIIGFVFNRSERLRDQATTQARAETERRIAEDHRNEQLLQLYFDRMSELLLAHGLRQSTGASEVRAVAHGRTLATLRSLDPDRKVLLLRFLFESLLIDVNQTVVPVVGVDLAGVDLYATRVNQSNLREVNLSRANLESADLFASNLCGADLSEANLLGAALYRSLLTSAKLDRAILSEADLSEADLIGASLSAATLQSASLCGAKLIGTDFTGADLQEADFSSTESAITDLSGAHFAGANLSNAKFINAYLYGADFSGAKVNGADFTGAVDLETIGLREAIERASQPPGGISLWRKVLQGLSQRKNPVGRIAQAKH